MELSSVFRRNSKSNSASSITNIETRANRLVAAVERLAGAKSLDEVIEILRTTARSVLESDGIAIILRDEDKCYYIAEDACEPLWAGSRFPAKSCISGIAMMTRATIIIPDIFNDPRVPIEAYRTTFVKSLVMVPIGIPEPVAAVGAYWAEKRVPDPYEVEMLEALARSAATALENGRLIASLADLNSNLEVRIDERTKELEQAHELLRQTQKLEVVGQLTGSVAHDFNNLLAPIMAGLDLVLRRGVHDERLLRNVTSAMEAAERAKTLVQRLLAFARRQPLQPSAVDLKTLVESMADLLSSTIGPRSVIQIQMAHDLPLVSVDGNQLEMAILNLAVNARDAMLDGGMLSISATPLDEASRFADLPEGEYVCLRVTDTGTGMDEKTLAKAVEPFFSTKGIGHGTGLGLSMVHGLAAQLGGGLHIMSEIGKGTTIDLCLPVAGGHVIQREEPEMPVAEIKLSKGLALVIDDEPIVRMGTADMLEELGFEVKEAESADKGLELIQSGLKPRIVITDHLMPGMSGAELARKIKSDHPDIALLLVSGYQDVDTLAPDVPRLTKPFRHAQLAVRIGEIFDNDAPQKKQSV